MAVVRPQQDCAIKGSDSLVTAQEAYQRQINESDPLS